MSTNIPAPVFAHDSDLQHTIFCIRGYDAAFGSAGVRFIVPYNGRDALVRYENALRDVNVQYIRCDSALKPTLEALVAACLDANWLLWLTGDRYPIAHRTDASIQSTFDLARAGALDAYSAIKFTRWRESELSSSNMCRVPELAHLYEERPYTDFGFWQPQLMKHAIFDDLTRTIRDESHPSDVNDGIVRYCREMKLPTLFPRSNILKLEEPIVDGKVMLNYAARRRRQGFGPVSDDEISPVTASFNTPKAPRLNPYWKNESISASEELNSGLTDAPFHVISFGGSGSKMLAVALFREMSELPDQAVRKMHSHKRIPPAGIPDGMHLIYSFGDPREAVLSFFNRRLKLHGAHGFFGNANALPPGRDTLGWVKMHLSNLQSHHRGLTKEWDLPRFLENGKDLFRLEEHFDNWVYSAAHYRTTFVRYETLWDNEAPLARHFGLEKLTLPKQIVRSSRLDDIENEDRDRLNDMYGEFAERLRSLPDIFYAEEGRFFDQQGSPLTLPLI